MGMKRKEGRVALVPGSEGPFETKFTSYTCVHTHTRAVHYIYVYSNNYNNSSRSNSSGRNTTNSRFSIIPSTGLLVYKTLRRGGELIGLMSGSLYRY